MSTQHSVNASAREGTKSQFSAVPWAKKGLVVAGMDKLLVEAARKLHADEIFETVRRCYAEANRDYLQKQISIASEYLSQDQKDWLREHGYEVR